MNPKNIPDIYRLQAEALPEKIALSWRRSGYQPKDITYSQLWDHVLRIASGFSALGLQKRSKVCIWSSNRPEWLVSDVASQLLGAPTVPIYTTLSASEITYIIKDSGARILIVENSESLQKIQSHLAEMDQLWAVIILDDDTTSEQISTLRIYKYQDLILSEPLTYAEQHLEASGFADIASVIYTSGTTGFPKGVLLSHGNFISNIEHIPSCLPMTSSDRHLSFLPLSHVFERTCGSYLMGYCGATIIYANGVDSVVEDAKNFKPTFLMAVPRFYEKVMIGIQAKTSSAGKLKKKILSAAGKASVNFYNSPNPSVFDRLCFAIFDKLVFSKFRNALGGNLRFGVSGGAPLKPEIGEFFLRIGILVLEGYGLTETSPVIALNRTDRFRFGSVGIPVSIANVTITDEGEIATSGPCIMQGYHHRPSDTAEVIKNGVFHTGDLGKIDADGFLWITGRKKDLIVLSGGKKVCPTSIESVIEGNENILRCVLYGESKNFLTAIIVPDFERIQKAFPEFRSKSPKDLCLDPRLIEWISNELEIAQNNLARFECVKKFILLPEDFTIDSGELTPTLKLKRNIVWGKYSKDLDRLYE